MIVQDLYRCPNPIYVKAYESSQDLQRIYDSIEEVQEKFEHIRGEGDSMTIGLSRLPDLTVNEGQPLKPYISTGIVFVLRKVQIQVSDGLFLGGYCFAPA